MRYASQDVHLLLFGLTLLIYVGIALVYRGRSRDLSISALRPTSAADELVSAIPLLSTWSSSDLVGTF
jgi:hypothetical protein